MQIHDVMCCALQDEAHANSLHPQVYPASIRTCSQLDVVLAINEGGHISAGKRARMVAAWNAWPSEYYLPDAQGYRNATEQVLFFLLFPSIPYLQKQLIDHVRNERNGNRRAGS